MKKIRDLTGKIFSGLFFFAITYFFLGQFALDWGITTRKFYENRNQYIKWFIKLDSTSYGYSEGSTSTNPYIHGSINNKLFTYESYNNTENQAIADTIELNNHSVVKKVWYHKEGHGSLVYSILFGETFPWQQFIYKNIIFIFLFSAIPSILAFYLIKNAIKLIILIYKKEYYNVEDPN